MKKKITLVVMKMLSMKKGHILLTVGALIGGLNMILGGLGLPIITDTLEARAVDIVTGILTLLAIFGIYHDSGVEEKDNKE